MAGQSRVPCLIVTLALLAPAMCSCDRTPAVPTTLPVAEPAFQLVLKPLTPLLPGRPTHPAVDPLGNIYWVQEADRDDDTLFVIGDGEVPRTTQLSAATISAALGVSGGRGHIQDVVAGPSGEIYFYFYGSVGRQALAAFGRFFPKTGAIQILADTNSLANVSGMGFSLPLRRGRTVTDGKVIWLWLRHTDASAIFRIDPRGCRRVGCPFPPRHLTQSLWTAGRLLSRASKTTCRPRRTDNSFLSSWAKAGY